MIWTHLSAVDRKKCVLDGICVESQYQAESMSWEVSLNGILTRWLSKTLTDDALLSQGLSCVLDDRKGKY